MRAHVYDSYAITADGRLLHFDILTAEPDLERARSFAQQWLERELGGSKLTTLKECRFCHMESVDEAQANEVLAAGYAVLKISGF